MRRLVGALGLLGIALFIGLTPLRYARFYSFCEYLTCSHPRLTPALLPQLEAIGLSRAQFAGWFTGLEILVGLVWIGAGVIIYLRARQGFALFVSLMLISTGSGFWTSDGPWLSELPAIVAIPQMLLGWTGIASLFLCSYLFPDGRFTPGWSRWLVPIVLPYSLLFFPTADQPYAFNGWPPAVQVGSLLLLMVPAIYAQLYRYRRISGFVERQQAKWFMGGLSVTFLLFAIVFQATALMGLPGITAFLVTGTTGYLAMMIFPVAVVFAVLRHRLWEIDLLIRRTLVYTGLTASVVAIYVLVVGGLGLLFQAWGDFWVSLVGTGLVAVLFQPIRERLQYWVNRIHYGERDDPYQAFSRLGKRLESTMAPDQVLSSIVLTVRDVLRLPYAGIALRQEDGFAIAAAAGSAPAGVIDLPLVYQSETLGQLLVAPRAPDEPFTAADRRLLEDLARQAGVAVHGVRLHADLQRSRERLVSVVEEERRRLRRDLHDGLGPRLAALGLKIGTARMLGQVNPSAVDGLLAELEGDVESTLTEIRRLVYNLRPPALDQLGLIGALQDSAAQYAGSLAVSVQSPPNLPPLPAAVEVAIYRICQEALTNIIRHARARSARVSLTRSDGQIILSIADDGQGLVPGGRTGVGLTSMRERAAEVGGSLSIESCAGGGTRVVATLPLLATATQ